MIDNEAIDFFKKLQKQNSGDRLQFTAVIGKPEDVQNNIRSLDIFNELPVEELKNGVKFYGPLRYNSLHSRFSSEKDEENLCTYVLDNSCFNRLTDEELSETDVEKIRQSIIPYAGISNVVIRFLRKDIDEKTAKAIQEISSLYENMHSKERNNKVQFIDVVNETVSSCYNIESRKKELYKTLLDKGIQRIGEIFVLPEIESSESCYQQNEDYVKMFNSFGNQLLSVIKNTSDNDYEDSQHVIDAFVGFSNIPKNKKLGRAAKKVQENAREKTYERIYQKDIDDVFKDVGDDVKKTGYNFQKELLNEILREKPVYDIEDIKSQIEQKIKEKIPENTLQNSDFKKILQSKIKKFTYEIGIKQKQIDNSFYRKIKEKAFRVGKEKADELFAEYQIKINSKSEINIEKVIPKEDIDNIKKSIEFILETPGITQIIKDEIDDKIEKYIKEKFEKLKNYAYKKENNNTDNSSPGSPNPIPESSNSSSNTDNSSPGSPNPIPEPSNSLFNTDPVKKPNPENPIPEPSNSLFNTDPVKKPNPENPIPEPSNSLFNTD